MITTINADLSSHTIDGALECHLPPWNPSTLQPFTSEGEVRAYVEQVRHVPYFFLPVPTGEELAKRAEQNAVQQRELAKQQRASAVASIKVTVDGLSFDGDEVSQGRMARAILAMETAGVEATPWTMSDNTIANVTPAQLRSALVKAGLAQTALWGLP